MDRAYVMRRLRKYRLTEFQERVLMATYSIPRGQTRTYAQVARLAGYPNAYRAVGTALRKNPMAPIIPCHRVIKSDGTLGNYSSGGTKRKEVMLRRERALA
jgi:methylated-DNA-[protein]-cysteine S-methyltransferase